MSPTCPSGPIASSPDRPPGRPRPIIIDTDPGIDDAMAIAVASASPELDVLALTTVFGNHDLATTTANARRVLDAIGDHATRVVPGAERPLLRRWPGPAAVVHGDDGLGDAGLPPPSAPPDARVRAAQFIVETVLARPGEVTLVLIGPLTNLALAVRLEPAIVDLVAEVVVMGGAARVPGNITPVAEANIWNDPHAAQVVLTAGWPVTLIGLDVTHRVNADRAWLDDIGTVDSDACRLVAATAPVYVRFHRDTDGLDGFHCHDVATVVHLLRPDLFTTEDADVEVVTDGPAIGATVARRRPGRDAPPAGPGDLSAPIGRRPVRLATDVDATAVLGLVRERLLGSTDVSL